MIEGTWSKDDPRRAFVDGAKWMLWQLKGVTMFPPEREATEAAAELKYPNGKGQDGPTSS